MFWLKINNWLVQLMQTKKRTLTNILDQERPTRVLRATFGPPKKFKWYTLYFLK